MKPHVLVVDDEKPMCELLEVGLGKRFDVVSRTSALDALEVIRNAPLDVVVADLRMAGMQGTELCRRALEIQPDLPVILITSFGSLESAIEAIRVGAYDFVTKPFQMETIARAIERAAQNHALKVEVRRLRVAVCSARAPPCRGCAT